jgi:S-adenosylmethionine:tRNA ribosyltransferase-isomerase
MGETPIPKYINRTPDKEDELRFQTVFARNEGAVAAPTAGLHFSRELMKRMELKGVHFAEITLHVGLGSFRMVEVEDLSKHKMDSEEMYITDQAVEIVNAAKRTKNRVFSVGTTTMRAIESSVSTEGYLKPYSGWTNKFIFPPYDFRVANALVTNFHMPMSTLLIMVSAFAGHDFLMDAYKEAIKEKISLLYLWRCHADSVKVKHHVVIVAGGGGSRMKSAIPKQFLLLQGRPLLLLTLERFAAAMPDAIFIIVLSRRPNGLLEGTNSEI